MSWNSDEELIGKMTIRNLATINVGDIEITFLVPQRK
jgi:hypothetical protein